MGVSVNIRVRLRGCVAILAVSAILAVVVIAPLASGPALADEEFYERIHQRFTPVETVMIDMHLAPAPAEELPPEPVAPAASTGAAPLPMYTGGGSPAEWMAQAGIAESDWAYVDYVVSRESGWNPNAVNAGSGACGLVQALPCSKVPGNGFDPVDNLRWANGYAVGRYGSWQGAYEFWVSNSWW